MTIFISILYTKYTKDVYVWQHLYVYNEYKLIGGENMKKFKTLIIAIILICIFTTSAHLCACKPDGAKQCTLALAQFYDKDKNPYITSHFDSESKRNVAEKINSIEELKMFCQEKNLKVFDESDNMLKYDAVCKKLHEYDEAFFQKCSIVLIFRFNETTDYFANNLVDISNGVMTINLISDNGNAYTATRTQIRIYEISKTIAQNINQIVVEEKLCELDQKVGVKILHDSYLNIGDGNYSTITRSFKELNEFCDGETSPIFKIGQKSKTAEILKEYDEEFFNNKSLVVIFRFRGSSGYFYRLENYDVNNNAINITLVMEYDDASQYTADVISCVYLIEMNKDEVTDVANINVKEIKEYI